MADTRPPEVRIDAGSCVDAPLSLIERAVRRTIATEAEGVVEVSVALVADTEMTELNRRYLDKDRTTDVLAFSLDSGDGIVGDVYVGFEQADRQAAELGVPLGEELTRLAIHGTLHVLGHDHPEGPERAESEMFGLQEALLEEVLSERGETG